jgi:hypothetical protein
MQRARFRPGIARTSIDSKKSFYNGVMQDLGTIQPGSDTVAGSLNDGDLVVGISNSNGNALAWIWSATTGMENLNTLITDPAWTLVTAS